MPLRVNFNILNQKGTPAFYSDIFANRPAAGYAGRVFISTDTGAIYEDTGSTWTLIADAGAGTTGTLQQVTTNGNTTTQGITITAGGLSSNSINNTALTTGSVLFSGASGLITQDNANLFWDDTNNRLGIGTAVPGAPLDVHSTGTAAQFNGTGINNAYVLFQNAGANKWRIGNLYNAGANSFEFVDAARSTNVMSLRSTGTYTEVFINGYNTINNIANLSSSGNYAINPSLTISIPASTSFNSGASYSGMATSLLNTWQGNNTFPIGAVMSGLNAVNRQTFNAAGTTITVSQSTGLRAITALNIGMQTAGSNNGTISHGAGMLIQGVYPTASANVTFTNYYGLLINQQDEYGTVTFTNRWGIYQQGTSDKNYFGGNMLIGSTTDNGDKLQVTGAATFSSSVTAASGLYNGYTSGLPPTSGSATRGGLRLNNASNIAFDFGTVAAGQAWIQVSDANNYASNFSLLLNPNGGNVGIGTSSPAYPLDVQSTSGALGISLRGRSADDISLFTFFNNAANTQLAKFTAATTYFSTDVGGSERMRITSGGNVLIGTTTDAGYKLQVSGTAVFTASVANGTCYIKNTRNNGSGDYALVTELSASDNNTSNYHLIAATGGADKYYIYGNGTYATVSDIRLKKNINTINDTYLDKIKKLNIVNYNWNDQVEGTELELGMIAQEVEKIIPNIVIENRKQPDGIKYKSIKVSALPYIIIKALQELNEKLERNNIN